MKTFSLKGFGVIIMITVATGSILLSSCNKNDLNASNQTNKNSLIGTYLGNPTSTITLADGSITNFNYTNRTIAINKGANPSTVIINSDIIITQLANITRDGFEIPETLAASVNNMTTKESATGILSGNSLTVHFIQKVYLNNVLNHTGTWDCVMTKQ